MFNLASISQGLLQASTILSSKLILIAKLPSKLNFGKFEDLTFPRHIIILISFLYKLCSVQ